MAYFRFEKHLKAASESCVAPSEVKAVFVCGGCMGMPALSRAVTAAFPKAIVKQTAPNDAAKGAALLLASQRVLLGWVDSLLISVSVLSDSPQ